MRRSVEDERDSGRRNRLPVFGQRHLELDGLAGGIARSPDSAFDPQVRRDYRGETEGTR
jgi:hypothetical protein